MGELDFHFLLCAFLMGGLAPVENQSPSTTISLDDWARWSAAVVSLVSHIPHLQVSHYELQGNWELGIVRLLYVHLKSKKLHINPHKFRKYRLCQSGVPNVGCMTSKALNGWSKFPRVEILRQVWVQQYYIQGQKLSWRQETDLPPNKLLIVSPYDPEVRNCTKGDTNWTGYAVHLTETCDQDLSNLA